MNEKFYQLPEEKQKRIINAGFRIFSQNSYKKSPVSEIADAAGISKSLLFFYFKNKLDLYMFLWKESARVTREYLEKFKCYEEIDLFEAMYRGMQAKIHVMKVYPDITAFTIKAFYEKDPEIKQLIQVDYQKQITKKEYAALSHINPNDYLPGLDLGMMYKEMYLSSEGYLWEQMQRNSLNADQMEQDFSKMIEFWKSVYLRK